ncbi:hypothetical protein P43SY_008387 [Pythium insidiosum]|uniref:Transposase n=1 Tax=Pythium insidiosum TaxID=114742 RepID=A0AAD5L9K8_PYTIN|nr:hypothetical protein P43SY_008387 [Pythium insidiosum]
MYAAAVRLRLPVGLLADLADEFECSVRSLSRLWKDSRAKIEVGTIHDGESGRRGHSGRKPRLNGEFAAQLATTIALLPLYQRTSIRTFSEHLGIPKSSLHVYYRAGAFHARLKPHLTDDHRAARMQFALSFVNVGPREGQLPLHLAPGEEAPHVTVQHKSFIVKVMFLVVVARPRWDAHKKQLSDGKIGVWPFVVYEPAQRSSKNRAKGTLELKTYTVDREIYRACLANSVIPEIKRRWPSGRRVRLQQDNAKPHVLADDEVIQAACSAGGWDMKVAPQPPNSPDFNVLDLGFFASLQTLHHQMPARNIEGLVDNVDQAFRDLSFTSLDRVFMTLQTVLHAAMKTDSGNRILLCNVFL